MPAPPGPTSMECDGPAAPRGPSSPVKEVQLPKGGLRRVIVWFRRDLRLADNPALVAALRMAPEVLPVYIWVPEEEGQFQPGRCSRWWLAASLQALDADLRALGSRLLAYRAPDSRVLLCRLAKELGAGAVLFNHLYDPISMVRDNEVKAGLAAAGVHCQSFNAEILREPWEVLAPGGKPFTCFDGFWGAHCGLPYPPPPPLPLPAALPPIPPGVEAGELKHLGIMTAEEEMSNSQLEFHWQPGSQGAHRLLDEFVRGGRLKGFDQDRAKTDRKSTSRLSPHIHYGEVSVRHIYYVAKHAELEMARGGGGGTSVADFLRQLGYREYSRYLSFHFPFTHERSLLEHLRAVPWRFDQRLFKAWRQGRTGYPLVDAAMREVHAVPHLCFNWWPLCLRKLWGTGWMHNRMRVVAASFLVKNLLLPWQWGLKHYWDALLDADLESDALGWQYVAGCMADAHEFSYMIDQPTEAQRFDPDGRYVRRWLPVLARLPAQWIHQPWLAPEHVLNDAGVELGVNYPWPVMEVEESAAALKAADAVVQACLRRGGEAGEGGEAAAQPAGPFRPATDAEPAEAERLFMENYRNSVMAGSALPPIVDRAEGLGESGDASSNIVLGQHGAAGAARAAVSAAPAATTLTGALSAAPAAARQAAAAAAQQAQQEVMQPQQAPAPAQQPQQVAEQALQPQQAILSMAGWRQLQTTPIGGSLPAAGSGPPGSGDGTGHATATGLHSSAVGVVPSLPGESPPGQVQQGGGGSGAAGAKPLPPRPAAQHAAQQAQQALQKQALLLRRAATNEGQQGQQGSNSPGSGPMDEGEQQAQWPPELQLEAPHGHKRQRQRSPPPA